MDSAMREAERLHWQLSGLGESKFLLACQTTLPPILLPLRDTAVAACADHHTTELVKYAAALQVAIRKLPDSRVGLTRELGEVLHTLAAAYDTLAHQNPGQVVYPLACMRALVLSGKINPSIERLLLIQCRALHASAHNPGLVARLYERHLNTTTDPLCHVHLYMGEAYWRARALQTSAPAPLTLGDESRYAAGHVLGNKTIRYQHYAAALAALQEPLRLMQASPEAAPTELQSLYKKHVEHAQAEASRLRAERGAYLTATGDYETLATPLPHVPLQLPPVTPDPPGHALEEVHDIHALDERLLHEANAWEATDAAHTLTRQPGLGSEAVHNIPDIMTRVMGGNAHGKHWPAALLAALNARVKDLEAGLCGGIDRKRDLQRVKEKRDSLLAKLAA
jgi:hypothetical protein